MATPARFAECPPPLRRDQPVGVRITHEKRAIRRNRDGHAMEIESTDLQKALKTGFDPAAATNVFAAAASKAGRAVGDAASGVAGAVAGAASAGAKAFADGARQVHQSFGGEYGEEFEGNLRDDAGGYVIPNPIVDEREYLELGSLTQRYEQLVSPSLLAKAGMKVADATPDAVKRLAGRAGDAARETFRGLTEQELVAQALQRSAEGFGRLEEQAARMTVGREFALHAINSGTQGERVSSLDEVCMLRSYDVAKAANATYGQHMGAAAVEGGLTGAAGFWGIPANFALSMLVYFRAVQSVAMMYGYDVKGDPDELVIAGQVFSSSMSPGSQSDASADYVGKVLLFAGSAGVRQAAKKGWTAMIQQGGAALLIAQMRALANKAAQKALVKNGAKELEGTVFRNVLKQVGMKMSLKNVVRVVPLFGAGVGLLFDTAQMDRVIKFADIFYHKRFIMEKPQRVRLLTGIDIGGDEEHEGAEE